MFSYVYVWLHYRAFTKDFLLLSGSQDTRPKVRVCFSRQCSDTGMSSLRQFTIIFPCSFFPLPFISNWLSAFNNNFRKLHSTWLIYVLLFQALCKLLSGSSCIYTLGLVKMWSKDWDSLRSSRKKKMAMKGGGGWRWRPLRKPLHSPAQRLLMETRWRRMTERSAESGYISFPLGNSLFRPPIWEGWCKTAVPSLSWLL